MTKEEIAGVLEQIATLLELKGENPFKIRTYTNTARAIETFGGNVPNLQDEEAVAKIPGMGKSIALKIKGLAATGSLKYLKESSAEFPPGISNYSRWLGLALAPKKSKLFTIRVSRELTEAGGAMGYATSGRRRWRIFLSCGLTPAWHPVCSGEQGLLPLPQRAA
jgi:DNA polymerase/3'-5' exonuclease PolX